MMTPYSGVSALAELLRIEERDYPSTHLYVMTITFHPNNILHAPHNVYFDETEKGDVIGVAGWISTFDRWIAFENAWRQALPPEAKGDFHYTDFWCDPTYWSAGWTSQRRLDFIKRLATIANSHTAYAIGAMVSKSVYESVMPENVKQAFANNPVHFLFAQCAVGLIDMYDRIPSHPQKPLRVMFDHKKGYEGRLAEMYYGVRYEFNEENILGNLSFGSRREEPPLQAADLLIGELRRKLMREPTEVFDVLNEKNSLILAFPDEASFRAHVEAAKARVEEKRRASGSDSSSTEGGMRP